MCSVTSSALAIMPVDDRKRKPRPAKKPYAHPTAKEKPPKATGEPRSSAVKPPKYAQSNLTLHDWLIIVEYFDQHQPMTQGESTLR